MSVSTNFNCGKNQSAIYQVPLTDGKASSKRVLKAQIQIRAPYTPSLKTIQEEVDLKARELFLEIMSSGFVVVNEEILGYLDIFSLLQLRVTSKAICKTVNYFLFQRTVFYDYSIPRNILLLDEIKVLSRELDHYSVVASYRIPRESKAAFEEFAVRTVAENIFQYILFRNVSYEEGTTDPIEQDTAVMGVAIEIATRLTRQLMDAGLMEVFTNNPFDDTAYKSMKTPLQFSAKQVKLLMEELIGFVKEDDVLDALLREGKRFDHAKTSEKLVERLEAALAKWNGLGSSMAKCRVVYATIARVLVYENKERCRHAIKDYFIEAMDWLTSQRGYSLSDWIDRFTF